MTLAFHMDGETALEAYDLFTFYGADTEEKRIEVIKQMIQQGYNITVFTTSRSPEQVVNDYTKHGSVLYMKSDGTTEIRRQPDGEERLQNKDYGICPDCERPNWDCSCNYDNPSYT